MVKSFRTAALSFSFWLCLGGLCDLVVCWQGKVSSGPSQWQNYSETSRLSAGQHFFLPQTDRLHFNHPLNRHCANQIVTSPEPIRFSSCCLNQRFSAVTSLPWPLYIWPANLFHGGPSFSNGQLAKLLAGGGPSPCSLMADKGVNSLPSQSRVSRASFSFPPPNRRSSPEGRPMVGNTFQQDANITLAEAESGVFLRWWTKSTRRK